MNNLKNKHFLNIFVIFISALMIIMNLTPISANSDNTNSIINDATLNQDGFYVTESNNLIQQYETEENKTHTIYWAKGITPPKMSSDPNKLGTKGYFEKDVVKTDKITNITYQVPMETNKGYFDFNKSLELEKLMCYLASASNTISWWLQQNKPYIEKYIEGIKSGRYVQTEGLVNINSINWDNLLEIPNLVISNNLYQQLLKNSPLVQTAFKKNYYSRYDDGYWMDPVFDFFINGYQAIHPLNGQQAPINNPSMFNKDINGGYFFPIFGKEVISQRHTQKLYEYYNPKFKEWILNGQGITIGYLIDYTKAHALSVWGVEYDENDNLCRIYVTDSDDQNSFTNTKPDTARGLHSMNVKNINDLIYIGNNEGPSAGLGNMIDHVSVLDLAQDHWERVINDANPLPGNPIISKQPKSLSYAIGAISEPLKVEASLPLNDQDKGAYLTYQWYRSDSLESVGTPISNATSNTYTPTIKTSPSKDYYYCVVTNNKYGKVQEITSSYALIETTNQELKDAVSPEINFKTNKKEVGLNSEVTLSATVLNEEKLGNVTYQWYEANNNTSPTYIRKLDNETSLSLNIDTSEVGRKFYFIEVINEDNSPEITGQRIAKSKSGIICVEVKEGISLKPQQINLKIEGAPINPEYGSTFSLIVSGGEGNGEYTFKIDGPAILKEDNTFEITGIGEIKISVTKESDGVYEKQTQNVIINAIKQKNTAEVTFDGSYSVSTNDVNKFVYTAILNENYEYSKDGGSTWQNSNIFDLIEPNSTLNFTSRIKETDFKEASKNAPIKTVNFTKLANTNLPELNSSIIENEDQTVNITIQAVDNAEYSINNNEFSDNNTFNNVLKSESIKLNIRYKETATLLPSNINSKTINLGKLEQDELTINAITNKKYGDEPFTLSTNGGSGVGLVTFESLDPTILTIENNIATIINNGNVTIKATKQADNQYNEKSTTLNITIAKKPLTIKVLDQTLNVNDPKPEFKVSIDGLVNGDEIANISFTENVDMTKADNYEIKVSTITFKKGNMNNYDINFVSGHLNVKQKEITPSPDTKPDTKPDIKPEVKPDIKPENNTPTITPKPDIALKPTVKPKPTPTVEPTIEPTVKPTPEPEETIKPVPTKEPVSNVEPETSTNSENNSYIWIIPTIVILGLGIIGFVFYKNKK